MVFVRIKRISGKEYGYVVANSWTGSGPRQKVSKYLGRVLRPAKAKSEDLGAFLGLTSEPDTAAWLMKTSFRGVAAALMKWELNNHGANSSDLKTNVENAEFFDDKGKPVVLAINDGFLCGYTAKRLLEYDASTDYTGYNLADALTAAGIAVDKEIFITLFGKMQAAVVAKKMEAKEDKAAKDFYY